MSPAHSTADAVLARIVAWLRWFFGVAVRERTYGTLAYLLVAFPLGLGYFILLVIGVSLPLGFAFALVDMAVSSPIALLIAGIPILLLMIVVGIPLVLWVLVLTIELAALERVLAERLLGADISTSEPARTFRERARRLVLDRGTWKGIGYLFSKFVLGVVSLIALIVGVAFTYVLVAAPLHYRNRSVGIHVAGPIEFVPELTYRHDGWAVDVVSSTTLSIADGELISLYVDSFASALVVSAVGVLVGLVVLHLFNALGWLYARYTELLLRGTQPSLFREPPTQ
ncbi:sensor domain-containing protein [Halopiger djelfimassiliensis]|uniref:sensor domain-containing protein n=1 Tax=Halopiger djelfimassiliensis TaxID=1293047 RepID=UPI0006781292|nr:sensor domain-containing protein [Halopiger djelfimassiliensis]